MTKPKSKPQNATMTGVRLRLLFVMLLAAILTCLSGCASISRENLKPVAETDAYCDNTSYINDALEDTEATRQQIERHNASRLCLCGTDAEKKAVGIDCVISGVSE